MPGGNPFNPSNFDPGQMPDNAMVVFDDTGYLDNGGFGDPAALGYTQTYIDSYLEGMFASNGLSAVVGTIDTQFADATYFIGISSAVTTSQGTTYYIDHGYQGTAGADVIMDFSGDTVADTGGGADLVLLGQGQHFVDAGGGNDVVVVGNADDVIKLGGGDDWLWANAGNDAVRAGGGDDTVLGMDGADTISGGRGADRIDGGAGDDRLTGGRDADVFVFAAGSGADLVRDYEIGLDRIELAASTGLASFNDVLAAASQQGRHTVITLGYGDEITLRHVDMVDLSASDFDFV